MKKKANEPLKTIFYFPHHASQLSEPNSKIDHGHCSNLCLLNALFCLKNNIFEFFSTQIFAMKVGESIKTIFYLTHYAFMLKWPSLKIEHTHFSKLCVLKRVVLKKKQHFGVFQSSNIRNTNKQVNKSHFLSCKTYLSTNLSKF